LQSKFEDNVPALIQQSHWIASLQAQHERVWKIRKKWKKEEKLDGVTHCFWRPKTNSGGVFPRQVESSATTTCFYEMVDGPLQNESRLGLGSA